MRGTIDPGDYKQYIFPLLFFKRICDVYDEEFETALAESDNDLEYATFAENHHFQVPEGAHWKDVREKITNVGMALQEAMRAIEKANPETLFGIFDDASWNTLILRIFILKGPVRPMTWMEPSSGVIRAM